MVDATTFGTTIVKVYNRSGLDMILERMDDGEGVLLLRDLTFDYEFLEEGRSLALVDKEGVDSKSQMHAVIKLQHEENEDGKFKPPLQFSFFQKSSVEKSVAAIAFNLGESQKKKEAQDWTNETFEEAGIGKNEKFQYAVGNKDWHIPELTGEDGRQGDTRYVSGGAPKGLGSSAPIATVAASPVIKKITKYMTGEKDEKKKVQKVYIEEEDIVNCEESRIHIEFKQTSYSVKVNSSSATYVLGPIECGHIIPSNSSWRLSKGKRLTISLCGTKPEVHPAEVAKAEMAAGTPDWYIMGGMIAFVCALLFLVIIGKFK